MTLLLLLYHHYYCRCVLSGVTRLTDRCAPTMPHSRLHGTSDSQPKLRCALKSPAASQGGRQSASPEAAIQ